MYFIIGAIIVLFILIFIMIYMYKKTSILKVIDKINNKYIRFVIRIILILIPFIIFGFVNGVVIVFHFAIFFLLFDLINKFVKNKTNLLDYIAIIITIIYLSVALYQGTHIYKTVYNVETTKDIETNNFKIIQISDSHTGTTFDGNKFKEIISNMEEADIAVITGDLVDDNTTHEDMVLTCEALSLFKVKYGIYFVYGNHDKGYFGINFKDEDLRKELTKNNIIILEDDIVNITDKIVLIGRKDASDNLRKSIDELTKEIDESKYIIDLNHQPNDYDNESKSKVDLVLSGHSHGGQLFPLGEIGVLTKANDEYEGIHNRNNTTFIVNTGISSWEILFKTGTKSEYTIINIRSKNE